ncbi:KCTD3 [Mytilus edulis]|uniref:KCTD3 n=1 Tax=Mytilus edulis TaxID=6550 RepID=A0A8S3SHU8_MYTED|nr:KCTD3 [Mytilus edulis]
MELHSPYGFKCTVCKKIFEKRTPRHGACEAGDSNQILINKQTGETGLKIRDEYNKFKEEHVHQNIAVETRKGKTPPKRKIRPFVSSASRGRSPIRNTEHRRHSRSPIRRRREEPVPSVKSIVTRLVSPARTSQTSNVPADQDTRIVLSQSPRAVATSGPPANTRARSDSSSSSSSSSEDSELSIHAEAGGVSPPASTRSGLSVPILSDMVKETIKRVRRSQENRVVLNIGGTKFETSKETLSVVPGSLFWALCQETLPESPLFLDRDPTHFKMILNYLRNKKEFSRSILPKDRRYLEDIARIVIKSTRIII